MPFKYEVQQRLNLHFPILKKNFLRVLEPVVVNEYLFKFLSPRRDIKVKPSLEFVPYLVDVSYFKDIADVLNR